VTEPSDSSAAPAHLTGYEVIVGVCGGIAAFKAASLVSQLVQGGAGVTVAMTPSARRFIRPLTFEALTARRVFTSLWDAGGSHDPQHLSLTEAADLLIVAPATANTIARIAHGMADEPVSTLAISATCPILLAPAMNTRMWENEIVQENLRQLKARGIGEVPPGEGWLACRTVGTGRMAEPETIFERAIEILKATAPKHSG
jgi:phosphopantothenoylcysteine decarboxylase/phosphopantothenate--cysteine ligase